MLRLIIPGDLVFNETASEFSTVGDVVLDLEHSLLSLSKWESKYGKPFLSVGPQTADEIFDYLEFMVVTPDGDLDALRRCPQSVVDKIQEYIDSSQSATTFGEMPKRRGPTEVITSELIYYWLLTFHISFECEAWHLNRLFSLIRICNIKNSKPRRMGRGEVARRNHDLNMKRRQELGTRG